MKASDAVQTGDMTDEEQPEPVLAEVPVAKEAFVSPEHMDDNNKATEHVYDGYELLLDIDESVLDDHLPPPTG